MSHAYIEDFRPHCSLLVVPVQSEHTFNAIQHERIPSEANSIRLPYLYDSHHTRMFVYANTSAHHTTSTFGR